jgi:hypothetical protein
VACALISLVLVELIEPHWLRNNDLALSARVASADFIQRRLRTPSVERSPIQVVLLSRHAIADVIVSETNEIVFPRPQMLRLVELLVSSGARAVALDFDMGAAPGDSFRDPQGDPPFFESLLAIGAGKSPICGGRGVPVVVGVGDRSLVPREQRLGRGEFAPLAVTLAIPSRESEFAYYLVARLRAGEDDVESMSGWLARQAFPVQPDRWFGFESLRIEALPGAGQKKQPSGAPPRNSAAYYYPDYSSIPVLLSETLVLDSLDPNPILQRMVKDRIVVVSHEELDERADVPGIHIEDRRFRLAHLHAAGAIALGEHPVRMPVPWMRRLLKLATIALGVTVALLQARRLMQRRKAPVGRWFEFRIACTVALVLFVGGALFSASTRIVIDDVLVEVPLLVIAAYLQMQLAEWLFHRFRPGGVHARHA